ILEAKPGPQADLALRIEGRPVVVSDRCNLSERARGHVVLRVAEYSGVEDVPDLNARFQPPLTAYREDAEHQQVEVVAAGTIELVSFRVAEANAGRLHERARIEEISVWRHVAEDRVGADQIGRLLVARR